MKQLRIRMPTRLGEVVSARLLELGATAVDLRPDSGTCELTAYCPPARERALLEEVRPYVEQLVQRLRLSPVPVYEVVEVDADWETAWARLLPPARLVPGLVLAAEGAEEFAAPGERVIWLEPGLYFGFGEHPTTQLMSEWLAAHVSGQRVLDVGCGTGVLSFVAAFVGATAVYGVDIDAPSVASAERNARRNGLDAVCSFSTELVQRVSGSFDVVVANIDARTLVSLADSLLQRMTPNGAVALTGVLGEDQAAEVLAAYSHAGVTLEVVARREEWVLLSGTRRTP